MCTQEMDGVDVRKATGLSCRTGAVHTLLTSTGSVVPAQVTITTKEVKGNIM